MKKLICFLMSAILLLSVFSCRKSNNEATTAGDSQKNETNDTTVAGSQPSEVTTKFQSWLTDSMEKVTGDATAPQSASAEIDIYMAKNEKQSFHIALRASENAEDLKVVITDGERDDISVEIFEEYLIQTGKKYYPDPIVPITDTFSVEKDMTECVLIRFTTSEDTDAGKHVYKFSITDSEGNEIGSYTANVNVWSFSLPENYSTATSTGLYVDSILSKEKLPGRLQSKYYLAYYEMLLDYGLSSYELPYDILDERADAYMSDPRVTSFRISENLSDEKIIEYYNKLKTNPVWLEKAYFIPLDEPCTVEHLDTLISRTERLKALAPEIKICTPFFMNIQYDGSRDEVDILSEYIDIWCPKSVCWQKKWLDDPLGKGYFGDRMDAQEAQGDNIWWYVCWEPGTPFCNMFVNEQGINHVELFWQQYMCGVDGFLYWSANYWTYVDDPWTDMATVQGWLSDSVFGDGSLLYPGKKVGIEGPVASLRLECIRNGLEDVELLKLAEELIGRDAVMEQVNKVTKSLDNHTKSCETFNSARNAIAALIEAALNNN